MRGASILIVEDEALIALDLTLAIEDAGGVVIGSAASCVEALEIIAAAQAAAMPITAAVLDINLSDRDSLPVMHRLHACGVPMVVYSATGLPEEALALSDAIPWVAKPGSMQRVVALLTRMIASNLACEAVAADNIVTVETRPLATLA